MAEPDDCDDAEALAYTGAAETCGDGVDNDCNGDTTECRPAGELWLADADRRRYGEAESDRAGARVAGGEDIDGDGHAELGVGVPGAGDNWRV